MRCCLQAHGVELQPFQYIVIWLCAALAAVSAAAIPSAGLVNLVLVLQAVNLDQYSGELMCPTAALYWCDQQGTQYGKPMLCLCWCWC